MKEYENRKNEINRNNKMIIWIIWIIWTGNNIGDEGAKMISESLKINTTLTYLDLRGDEIEINEKKQKNIKAKMK